MSDCPRPLVSPSNGLFFQLRCEFSSCLTVNVSRKLDHFHYSKIRVSHPTLRLAVDSICGPWATHLCPNGLVKQPCIPYMIRSCCCKAHCSGNYSSHTLVSSTWPHFTRPSESRSRFQALAKCSTQARVRHQNSNPLLLGMSRRVGIIFFFVA